MTVTYEKRYHLDVYTAMVVYKVQECGAEFIVYAFPRTKPPHTYDDNKQGVLLKTQAVIEAGFV